MLFFFLQFFPWITPQNPPFIAKSTESIGRNLATSEMVSSGGREWLNTQEKSQYAVVLKIAMVNIPPKALQKSFQYIGIAENMYLFLKHHLSVLANKETYQTLDFSFIFQEMISFKLNYLRGWAILNRDWLITETELFCSYCI